MNTLIVDHSPAQQILLGKRVEAHPQLHLLAKVGSAVEAQRCLREDRVDLLFLDVEMPIITGFDLLDSLVCPPITIITTWKRDYTLKAFEYGVLYYILKPVNKDSFRKSVKKAMARHKLNQKAKEGEQYLMVKSDHVERKVFFNSIHWVEAIGDYIKIVTDKGNIITLTTMKCFATKLPGNHFLRIHKSYIVNLNKINRFNSRMVEIENTPLPLSRNKCNALDKALMV